MDRARIVQGLRVPSFLYGTAWKEDATEGLVLYEASEIPCVAMPLPEGVLAARLHVDLAYVPTADPAVLPGAALARMPFTSRL